MLAGAMTASCVKYGRSGASDAGAITLRSVRFAPPLLATSCERKVATVTVPRRVIPPG